jgi:hypothetical protein
LVNLKLETLLSNPEVENAVNEEAAEMYLESPQLFHQLARDAVVASRRLEQGIPMFDDYISEVKEAELLSEKSSVVSEVSRPPVKILSFDEYYDIWKNTGTCLHSRPNLPKGPVPPKILLKFKTKHTKISNAHVKDLLET